MSYCTAPFFNDLESASRVQDDLSVEGRMSCNVLYFCAAVNNVSAEVHAFLSCG